MFEREPNIDIVFRNGLKNLEVLPPADVWDNIPPMPVRTSRLRIISGIAAGVAALVSLTLLATWYGRNSNTPVLLTEVTTPDGDTRDVPLDIMEASPIAAPAGAKVITMPRTAEPAELPLLTTVIPAADEPARLLAQVQADIPAIKNQADEPARLLAQADIPAIRDQDNTPVELLPEEITIVTAGRFAKTEESPLVTLAEIPAAKTDPRFIVGASVSPTMGFSRTGEDARITGLINSERSRPTYSTGVSVGYRISDRLTVHSGIGLASMGQTITDVAIYAGLSDYYAVKSNYLYSLETATGTILAGNTDLYLTDTKDRVGTLIQGNMADPSKYNLTQVGSDIHQVFRYLELPVMVRYRLIDRKVGLNLSGGVAYGLLVGNTAYTGQGSETIMVGHTEGVNEFNLSSQVGLGMEYNVSQKITFNLEPVFRYYVTPLSNFSGAIYKPYSLGFYSGFYFKF